MLSALIVPCYNEADRFPSEIFLEWLRSQTQTYLVLVDDGSRDATLPVLERIRVQFPEKVHVLSLKPNRGKAEAVRNGLLFALDHLQPDIIGFWDADLATPLDVFDRFVEVLNSRPDIEMIFGARVKLLGRHVERLPYRHYLGRVFATAASVMLNLPIYDTQCGAKLFVVKPHTRRIFADPFLSKWVFDVEIIARYLQMEGCETGLVEKRIYEYPLETWIDVAGSKVRPKDFILAFWDTLRIRVHYLSRRGAVPAETSQETEKTASH